MKLNSKCLNQKLKKKILSNKLIINEILFRQKVKTFLRNVNVKLNYGVSMSIRNVLYHLKLVYLVNTYIIPHPYFDIIHFIKKI